MSKDEGDSGGRFVETKPLPAVQLFIGVLFWIRLLAVFCFCTFECGGKHFVFPFGLITLIWPVGVVQYFIFLFTDPHNRDFNPLVFLVGLLGVPSVIYLVGRPLFSEFFRTDWRSQLGPLAVLLVYVGYLTHFIGRGCWSEGYLPYASWPVLLFSVAQLGIFLANLRNPSPLDS